MEITLFITEITNYLYDNVKDYDYNSIEDYFDTFVEDLEIDVVYNLKEVHINFKYDNNTYIVSNLNDFKLFHSSLINKIRKKKMKRIL
jgi:hypothetical protein